MSKKTEIVLLEITIRPQDPNWVSPDSGQLYLRLVTIFIFLRILTNLKQIGILQYYVINKISIR